MHFSTPGQDSYHCKINYTARVLQQVIENGRWCSPEKNGHEYGWKLKLRPRQREMASMQFMVTLSNLSQGSVTRLSAVWLQGILKYIKTQKPICHLVLYSVDCKDNELERGREKSSGLESASNLGPHRYCLIKFT